MYVYATYKALTSHSTTPGGAKVRYGTTDSSESGAPTLIESKAIAISSHSSGRAQIEMR